MKNADITSNKHYKVISSSQISIYVVEDPTIYMLNLTSSVGELINPSVETITITASLTADNSDITSAVSRFVWKKYIYDLDTPILDESWGKDLNRPSIVLTRDDFFTRCKIECECYVIGNNDQEHRVAGHYITLVDINDLMPSDTEPKSPKDGQLWLDTSQNPPILKIFKDGQWININSQIDDIQGLIDGLKQLDSIVSDLKDEIDNENILLINNNEDTLWKFDDGVTSTNGYYPINNYKLDSIIIDKGKFKNCLFVGILDKDEIKYDKKVLDTNNDFTINMHLKPGNQIVGNNSHNVISTGNNVETSFLTMWSLYPDTTDPSGKDRRFCIDFGNDLSGNRQYIDLIRKDKITDWVMITITFELSKKEFAIYINGDIWGIHKISKLNNVEHFSLKRSGMYYENLTILKKALSPKQIKSISTKNKPFDDHLPKILVAPTPEIIEFNSDITSEVINTNVLISNMKNSSDNTKPGDMFFDEI